MSHTDWEAGTIKLPTAEYARVRKALQDADTRHKEMVFEQTQEMWKGMTQAQKASPVAFRDELYQESERRRKAIELPGATNMGFPRSSNPELTEAIQAARLKLGWTTIRGAKPRRILRSEMDFPTSRTTEFRADVAVIKFDRADSTIHWEAREGNRAVEQARDTHLAEALFTSLNTVKWTRGTGGAFTGNDEDNEDRDYGGGGNYFTDAYGPIGAEMAPDDCRPYTDFKGNRVTEADLMKIRQTAFVAEMQRQGIMTSGSQGRVSRGVIEGGQFTHARRGESGVRLR